MDWLPIESAPKDTWVDLWVRGRTEDGIGEFRIPNCWRIGNKWYSSSVASFDKEIKSTPTHWMPLPPPPNA